MTTQPNGKPLEILIVEDNPDDAELIIEAMKCTQIRWQSTVIDDGAEALEYLSHVGKYPGVNRPDLIILDLNLPKKDGREVLAQIKSDNMLKRIPVVVLTTSKSERDVLSAYDAHANCYIVKPLNLDQLLNVAKSIESWLTAIKLPSR